MIKHFQAITRYVLLPVVVLAIVTGAYAAEVVFPVNCYNGEELAGVRAWEKQWAGKKISSKNVDSVKEFIPDGLYKLMTETDRWGESWFEIAPYESYPQTPGTIEYTRKYSPQCKITDDRNLAGWVAGVPFPSPESGLQIGWNFDCWNRGDTYESISQGHTVDGRIEAAKESAQHTYRMQFSGRTDMDPHPEIDRNKHDLKSSQSYHFLAPAYVAGTMGFTLKYKDNDKEWDSWTWSPTTRRISRVSTAQRTTVAGTGDITRDDNHNWDGAVRRNVYRLLGRKEILVGRNIDPQKLIYNEGDCLFDGIQRQRINCYVVEVECKDPGYIYKKSIWYVDPEIYNVIYAEKFDRYGRLWKIQEQMEYVGTSKLGFELVEFGGVYCIDYQRVHSTLSQRKEYNSGIPIKRNYFSVNALLRRGR